VVVCFLYCRTRAFVSGCLFFVLQNSGLSKWFGNSLCFVLQNSGLSKWFGNSLCFVLQNSGLSKWFGNSLCFVLQNSGLSKWFNNSLCFVLQNSGLSKWFGNSLAIFSHYSPFVLCLVISLLVASVTEVTSNTATATLLMPILQELVCNVCTVQHC
jgi:di/tricarboxylate transporter